MATAKKVKKADKKTKQVKKPVGEPAKKKTKA